MRPLLAIAALGLAALSAAGPAAGGELIGLCYHDVRDDLADDLDADPYAVGTDRLIAQFEWLRAHGWTPVSVDEILEARAGRQPLPEKAILLSFDDGYESVYTRVFPLLRLFRYPAVVAIVTSQLESEPVDMATGKRLMTAEQLRELASSELIEIASHSHDLHHGILGNPQGNRQPAAVTRRYDPEAATYESESAYRQRLGVDLARSADAIATLTGQRPRVVVWPYGASNRIGQAIAAEHGMSLSLGLGEMTTSMASDGPIGRSLLVDNPDLGAFVWDIVHAGELRPQRVTRVRLDDLYAPSAAERERRLGRLIDRVHALGITTVHLETYADPDRDGRIDGLYYPNRSMPMRADLFNRVAWQLRTRAGVAVYARMFPLAAPSPGDRGDRGPTEASIPVLDLFEDLARRASFQGLVLELGTASGGDTTALTRAVVQTVRRHRPEARSVRAVAVDDDVDPSALKRWLARLTPLHDELVLELAPGVDDELADLADALLKRPTDRDRTVFLVHADDRDGLNDRLRLLQRSGAVHVGYYPDRPMTDQPPLEQVRPAISIATYPFRKP